MIEVNWEHDPRSRLDLSDANKVPHPTPYNDQTAPITTLILSKCFAWAAGLGVWGVGSSDEASGFDLFDASKVASPTRQTPSLPTRVAGPEP